MPNRWHGYHREQPLKYLQTLDVGFGYTADKGATYPLRRRGIGLMPSLGEVLQRFPDRRFIVHIKSNDPHDGIALAEAITTLPNNETSHLAVTGGDRPIEKLRAKMPFLRTMSRSTVKRCLSEYAALG